MTTERCHDRNLPDDVTARADLAGKPFRDVFTDFCQKARITHDGAFFAPDEDA